MFLRLQRCVLTSAVGGCVFLPVCTSGLTALTTQLTHQLTCQPVNVTHTRNTSLCNLQQARTTATVVSGSCSFCIAVYVWCMHALAPAALPVIPAVAAAVHSAVHQQLLGLACGWDVGRSDPAAPAPCKRQDSVKSAWSPHIQACQCTVPSTTARIAPAPQSISSISWNGCCQCIPKGCGPAM